MRVAVIGYGVEGRTAVAYWQQRGHEVTVHAPKLDVDLPDGVTSHLGPGYLDGLGTADLIVRSPGVRPDILPGHVPTTSVIKEFLDRCPGLVVGVTGTQGKGTTCKAIEAILTAAGRRVFFGGNIGLPPLEFLDELRPDDVTVLELSNFQLVDLEKSPQVAVVLAVTPDHLNWHTNLDEYYTAKRPIASFQQPSDTIVFDVENPVATRIAESSSARRVPVNTDTGFHAKDSSIWYGNDVLVDAADINLRGEHNLSNLTAAVAAVFDLVNGDCSVIRKGTRSLEPLPHRLFPVANIDGVLYVNDSLSTTPETTRAAVRAYPEPKVLILGGSSKGLPFEPLAETIAAANIRAVLVTGQDGPRIGATLDSAGLHDYELPNGTMADVVARAATLAQPGDVVLLSPSCASFDRYRDYADRGNQFMAAVHDLPGSRD